MKKLYIIFFVSVAIIICLIVIAFVFFEKEKHRTLLYALEEKGRTVGHIKFDRYKTEDMIIYKATSFLPKKIDYKVKREKIAFRKKGFLFEQYTKEETNFGSSIARTDIRTDGNSFDFLSRIASKSCLVSDVSMPKDATIFDPASIVTYMPIVDKYDFSRGGAQSFNVIYSPIDLLPPANVRVVFTSIRDEYITVGRTKTKTEVLTVRSKIFSERYIWVSKRDRMIVKVDIKSENLLLRNSLFIPNVQIVNYKPAYNGYVEEDVLFPSGDIALAGTLTIPDIQPGPAVLLVGDYGLYDRDNAGIFTQLSHELGKNGYTVLRYDKRGLGGSQGAAMAQKISDEIHDIQNALHFLASQEKVDKDKLFVISHAESSAYLPKVDVSGTPVRGFVMLGLTEPVPIVNFDSELVASTLKIISKVDHEYTKTLNYAKQETHNLVNSIVKDHAIVRGKRAFVTRMREILEMSSLEHFKNIATPFILIHGKKGRYGTQNYIKELDKVLIESGFKEYSIVYFRELGHFLGKLYDETDIAKHYRLDNEVTEVILEWLNEKCLDETGPPSI